MTYVQNAEQGDSTLWQRVLNRDQMAPVDRLYREYSINEFKDIDVTDNDDPEFVKFVTRIRERGPKFSIYTQEQLERFARKIYELRKD